MKYYKNKYLIGIYNCQENDDSLIALCESSKEFCEFLNITYNDGKHILRNYFSKRFKHLRYNGKLCEVYFIDVGKLDLD